MTTETPVKTWVLKGCPHCGGDLLLEDVRIDGIVYYQERVCLQCSRSDDKTRKTIRIRKDKRVHI